MQLLLTWAALAGCQDEQQLKFVYLMMVNDSSQPVWWTQHGLSLAYQRGVYSCKDVPQASLTLFCSIHCLRQPFITEGFSLTQTLKCLKTQSTEAALYRVRPQKTWRDSGPWPCGMGHCTEERSHRRGEGLGASRPAETYF